MLKVGPVHGQKGIGGKDSVQPEAAGVSQDKKLWTYSTAVGRGGIVKEVSEGAKFHKPSPNPRDKGKEGGAVTFGSRANSLVV